MTADTADAGAAFRPDGEGPVVSCELGEDSQRSTAAGPVLVVHVLGTPAPQGSKVGRPIYRGRGTAKVFTGKVAQVESSALLPTWREAVKHAAHVAIEAVTSDTAWSVVDGPIYVHSVYTFNRPKHHFRTGRNAHLLRDNAPLWPASSRNDIEKLDRGSRDALTDAGVWVDDGLVVHHESWKAYPGSHPDALPTAGAVIRIFRMEAA